MRLPDVDYSWFVYPASDSRHGLPRPTRRYAASGDPAHARTEYWFGGLSGVGTGGCVLKARSPGVWTSSAPKRVLVDFPIIGRFTVHQLMEDGLRRALQDIKDAGLADQIDVSNTRSVGGTYCCRYVRGGSTPSPHAWAIAIDLNPNHHLRDGRDVYSAAATNYQEAAPPSLAAIAPYFTRLGFTWGGHWVNPRDPMHFELTPLTLLIMAGERHRLPAAFVARCGEGLPGAGSPVPTALQYPPAGTPVKIVIQHGDDYELLGEGVFDGEMTRVPVRLIERATTWAAARMASAEGKGPAYELRVTDHLRDQRKVYVTVDIPPQGE